MKLKRQQTTSKKVKVVGHREYTDNLTGEIQDMQVISVEDRDFNFHKVWLQHILNSIDLIGNQKTKLAFWIIENLNKENQLVMTQREIAKQTQISLETVRQTLKALSESNFLQKINSGAYRVNPEYVFKGTRNNRLTVAIEYVNKQAENRKNESDARTDTTSETGEPV